ncbi:hydantoinase [Salinigranum rubrum]|uniref:Hydantoinase n=1 Tax=Salinigranum rubrum TaxID=755307 RepID=A0A2I8VNG8_9EURY|nr:hydantoinase/oxoprolinase family protein [Salinigranum rubrum]AUV83477.1 hydantoinase [Salinigranum rubrum]
MSGDVRVGVDIGGTFTDLVTIQGGRIRVSKTPSTPDAPEEGVIDGLRKIEARDGLTPEQVTYFGHGTTVATNAVLEEEWADTALVTTEGFRDVLEIGRQARPDIYDFQAEKPTPIVERHRRFEVPERLDERGDVVKPLDEAVVRRLASDLSDVDSVAVSLLYPFEDDTHERRVRDLLREEGVDASFSLSSKVLPEIREYERTLTTALNAALKPVMDRYIGRLEDRIGAEGVAAPLKVMQSNGGIITADAARERPVNTLLSGPAAGVQGATYVASRLGDDDVITMDMGGTSCDVSLVEGGDPVVSTDVEVGEYPVSVPTIDIHTVGSGGGSLAWIDSGGALRVGPASAGADPGPVCYGRGGTRPTITDAHAVLGRIDPGAFVANELDTESEAVERAVETHVAEGLGVDVETAAQGILDVANANMERALRVVSVERGYDPREFGLVAFGGAGPLHAPKLAAELDIPRVLVPRTAGVLSALGLLISDTLYDHSTSRVRRLDTVDPEEIASTFASFVDEGRAQLDAEGLSPDRMQFEPSMDLRYAGQSFELSVPAPVDVDDAALETVRERFHDQHRQRYGHAYREEPVELVTLRLRARGVVETPDLRPEHAAGSVAEARVETRRVVYDGEPHDTPVYDRTRLPPESGFDGPAVVEGRESTTVVHPGQRVQVDADANLVVEVTPDA